ncbi:conserved hypothetical protein, membrane [Beggiatoa sp. PS]|nr:conserved hypothetical protein, membrane [Beggiatoa sp. PS]
MLECNPDQAPTISITENDFELAERNIRLWAFLVDVFIIGIALILLLTGMVFAFLYLDNSNHIILNEILLLLALIPLMVFIINLILLYRNGQTIGKRLFAIKIVRTSGNRVGLLRLILVRYFSFWLLIYLPFWSKILLIFLLLDELLIFQNSRQCWHDLIADTIVIKATQQ